jgi:hypothetical protein
MVTLYLPLVVPSEFNAPRGDVSVPEILVEATLKKQFHGSNSVLLGADAVRMRACWERRGGAWERTPLDDLPCGFDYFSRPQRACWDKTVKELDRALDGRHSELLRHAFPLIVLAASESGVRLYHFNDMGPSGSIYVCYHYERSGGVLPLALGSLLESGRPALDIARRSANDNCHHGRWRQDLEFERKFTFSSIPDTWMLINDLYTRIRSGDLPRFVPEVGLEFQVYDYEVCMFDVLEPEVARGYIAFIPQTNGKICVKQKWFKANAELRKETLTRDVVLAPGEFAGYAAALCGGKVLPLPSYRRKRFDVNFESLETGNVYGIFFDICRTVEPSRVASFSQCEVEYCRSRTYAPFTQICEQFEVVCDYTRRFLWLHGVDYRADLYSKLDFVRSAA